MKTAVFACVVLIGVALISLNAWRLSDYNRLPTNHHDSAKSDQPLPEDNYYDIGDFHESVSTDSKLAQRWFDRGLAMCVAFNHEEGVRCFQKALKADPKLAMAYWGIAYATGPNMNNMETPEHAIAQAAFALQLAKLHSDNCTDLEKQLIVALEKRYPVPTPPVDKRTECNTAYADEMRKVFTKNQNSALVHALFAESLINLQPWGHYSRDGKPAEHTEEIVSVLESGLKRWPKYPALCHFYIHTVELGPNPEKALTAAGNLGSSMPGAGHLIHMPSHIYVLVGDYEQMISSNKKAIEADKEFLKREGANNFFTLYRIHNYHFLVYGAMFDGQKQVATEAAYDLVNNIPEEMLRTQTDLLDAFMPMPLHVMIRFGQWEEILKYKKPADYLPMTTAMWHYARAIAYAATDHVELAENEQRSFLEAKWRVPETSILFNNSSASILEVAEFMVAGEIQYRKNNFENAYELLEKAVQKDDALNYDEPWGWMQPARHALGALLLEQGHAKRAEAVYRKDLQKRPNNAWALRGLIDCLKAQGKTDEASRLNERFKLATKRSDINIDRSCFCKNRDQ